MFRFDYRSCVTIKRVEDVLTAQRAALACNSSGVIGAILRDLGAAPVGLFTSEMLENAAMHALTTMPI
jgi:hypothetical protein